MNTNRTLDELLKLDPLEQIGRQYFEQTGRYLHYSQYLYLMRLDLSRFSLADLDRPEAKKEQHALMQHFNDYEIDGHLSENVFFVEGQDIEIEKILRYVDIPSHSNHFAECLFVLRGTCRQTIGDRDFLQEAGSFLFIPSKVIHRTEPDPDCLCLNVKIKPSRFVKLELPNMPYYSSPLLFSFGEDPTVPEILTQLYLQQTERKPYSDIMSDLLLQTLLVFVMQNYMETLSLPTFGCAPQKKLLEILNYMYENYSTITLRSTAEHFHYSESYLSNLFRQNFGETFTQSLRRHRMNRAKEYLVTTRWHLEEICEAIGYKDTTQFIRNFKEEFGVTPGQYRKQFKDPS